MPLPDYYSILEVPASATLEQIKHAYRRLAREHHPDVNKEVVDTHIKRVNEAYEVLSDVARRTAYDALLLEELRHAAMHQALRHQREEMVRRHKAQEKMTWSQGLSGFMRELKKEMRDES